MLKDKVEKLFEYSKLANQLMDLDNDLSGNKRWDAEVKKLDIFDYEDFATFNPKQAKYLVNLGNIIKKTDPKLVSANKSKQDKAIVFINKETAKMPAKLEQAIELLRQNNLMGAHKYLQNIYNTLEKVMFEIEDYE